MALEWRSNSGVKEATPVGVVVGVSDQEKVMEVGVAAVAGEPTRECHVLNHFRKSITATPTTVTNNYNTMPCFNLT